MPDNYTTSFPSSSTKKIGTTEQTAIEQMLTNLNDAPFPVKKAADEIKARLQQTHDEQCQLQLLNKGHFEKRQDLSGNGLAKKIKEDLAKDIKILTQFNTTINKHPNKDQILYPVKTNKMLEIFEGTKELFAASEDEENIVKLATGKAITSFDNDYDGSIPIFNVSNNFWGSPKTSFYSNALLSIYFTLSGKTIANWHENSAITHLNKIPNDLTIDISDNWRFFAKENEMQCFGYVHSGYALGGGRHDQNIYLNGKIFAPQDCSSWLSVICGGPPCATFDQLYFIRSKRNIGSVPSNWCDSKIGQDLLGRYDDVADINKVKPGDIYYVRTFPEADTLKDRGNGGHTGIVLGETDNKVAILNYNRDMPSGLEGSGITLVEKIPQNPHRVVNFYRLNEPSLKKLAENDPIPPNPKRPKLCN